MSPPIGLRRSICLAATAAVAFGLAGCNDPYSERRIRLRMSHLNSTAYDIQHREEAGVQRLDEAGRTIEKWWKMDSERFQQRVESIGDYIW